MAAILTKKTDKICFINFMSLCPAKCRKQFDIGWFVIIGMPGIKQHLSLNEVEVYEGKAVFKTLFLLQNV